jgi:hypothetical protein
MHSEKLAKGMRVRGALMIDGRLAARAERSGDDSPFDASRAVLRDLLIKGDVMQVSTPLYKRPLFWIALGASAAIAAGVTAYFVAEPDVQTSIRF